MEPSSSFGRVVRLVCGIVGRVVSAPVGGFKILPLIASNTNPAHKLLEMMSKRVVLRASMLAFLLPARCSTKRPGNKQPCIKHVWHSGCPGRQQQVNLAYTSRRCAYSSAGLAKELWAAVPPMHAQWSKHLACNLLLCLFRKDRNCFYAQFCVNIFAVCCFSLILIFSVVCRLCRLC